MGTFSGETITPEEAISIKELTDLCGITKEYFARHVLMEVKQEGGFPARSPKEYAPWMKENSSFFEIEHLVISGKIFSSNTTCRYFVVFDALVG